MTSRARQAAAAAVTIVLVVACSDADEDPAAEPTTPVEPAAETTSPPAEIDEPVQVVWSVDLDIVAGPRIAGDTVLVHVVEGEQLSLVGFDADSSAERWRAPASPGEVVTGIAVVPRVVDGHPVYFRPHDRDNLYAELVVADPVTGDDIAVSDALLFRSTPSTCPDDERAICLQVRETYDDTATAQRMGIDADGSLTEDTVMAGVEHWNRPIGARGLVDLRVDDVEYLAVYEAGEELWRHPVEELFGERHSSNFGWSWGYDEATDLYIGSFGFEPDETEDTQILDMSRGKLVAVERTTGEVRWIEEGVYDHCGGAAAVPGDDAIALQAAGESVAGVRDLPVRCHVSGELVFGSDVEPEPVDIRVEGYDPATGRTVWQVEAGDARVLLGNFARSEDGPVMLAGSTGIVVDIDGTPTVIDLATGETAEAGDETLWCRGEPVSFDYHEPYYINDEPITGRYGDSPTSWCDADGAATGEPPAEVHHAIGQRIGDVTYVMTTGGLVAYR